MIAGLSLILIPHPYCRWMKADDSRNSIIHLMIKYRFSPPVIEALLQLRWWEWSIEKIHENLQEMNDPIAFLKKHGMC